MMNTATTTTVSCLRMSCDGCKHLKRTFCFVVMSVSSVAKTAAAIAGASASVVAERQIGFF
jgi:hypothetical protein